MGDHIKLVTREMLVGSTLSNEVNKIKVKDLGLLPSLGRFMMMGNS